MGVDKQTNTHMTLRLPESEKNPPSEKKTFGKILLQGTKSEVESSVAAGLHGRGSDPRGVFFIDIYIGAHLVLPGSCYFSTECLSRWKATFPGGKQVEHSFSTRRKLGTPPGEAFSSALRTFTQTPAFAKTTKSKQLNLNN